jgi:hypothetical protein
MKLKKKLAAIALAASVMAVPVLTESIPLLHFSNTVASATYYGEVTIDDVVYKLYENYGVYYAFVTGVAPDCDTVTIQNSISYNEKTYVVQAITPLIDINITKLDIRAVNIVNIDKITNSGNLQEVIIPETVTEENAENIIEKYGSVINAMSGDNLTINGVELCTFSDDNTTEPELGHIFKKAIYKHFLAMPDFSNMYTERYVEYVVKNNTKPGDSDIKKAIKLHDWLDNHVTYNPLTTSDERDHVNASVFLHHEDEESGYKDGFYTVCDGYARAYKLLMDKAGVTCKKVYGKSKYGNSAHAWNIVEINGRWYYIDSTWDDYEDNESGVRYDYFLRAKNDLNHSMYTYRIYISDEEISKDEINLPTYSIKTLGDVDDDENDNGLANALDLKYFKENLKYFKENDKRISEVQRANADINFDGKADENDIKIMEKYFDSVIGDVNCNGVVDDNDKKMLVDVIHYGYFISPQGFEEMPSSEHMRRGDIDMDGDLDQDDVSAIQDLINKDIHTSKRGFLEGIRLYLTR